MAGRVFKGSNRNHEIIDVVGVLDGYWVLEVSEKFIDGIGKVWDYELIGGVTPEKHVLISDYSFNPGWGYSYSVLVAKEPFAALTWQDDDGLDGSVLGRRLAVARQIHKGELGQYPPIPMPKFAMVGGLPQGNAGRRDKRRNKLGWARLTEVAELAGKSAEQILDEFWPVIDYHWGDPQYVRPADRPVINIVEANDASLITADEQQVSMQTYSMGQVLEMLRKGHDFSNWWIRKGTAKAILYVVHFGHSFDSVPV